MQGEQSRLNKKLVKLTSSVSDISGQQQKSTALEHEWESLEKSKQALKEQVDKFMQDRERMEKDMLEFRSCKEAQEKATKGTMDEFKLNQAKIV